MRKIFLAISVLFFALSAFSKTAEEFTFDGIRLGDNYQEKIAVKFPYTAPCDNDPVDKNSRRAMFYAPVECRRMPAFPDNTLVTFYLKFDDSDKKYSQPVEALFWLGGNYFEGKTDFPYKVGINPETIKEFGKAEIINRDYRKKIWQVYRFKGNISAISLEGKVLGYIIGPMPESFDNEQWRMIFKIYRMYYMKGK